MPYYTFDLVLDEEFKNQGTIILENMDVASERADQLAIELSQVRPELKARGCAVRVADVDNRELYRTPLDPVRAGCVDAIAQRSAGADCFQPKLRALPSRRRVR